MSQSLSSTVWPKWTRRLRSPCFENYYSKGGVAPRFCKLVFEIFENRQGSGILANAQQDA